MDHSGTKKSTRLSEARQRRQDAARRAHNPLNSRTENGWGLPRPALLLVSGTRNDLIFFDIWLSLLYEPFNHIPARADHSINDFRFMFLKKGFRLTFGNRYL